MNRAGIDKSVIFDWSGSLEGDFFRTNDKVFELSRYSDKFIGFGVPSATDPQIISLLYDKGARGLKVNPSLQVFFPNSDEFISVCREANKYNLPILIHTGPESAGKLKYDLPLLIDDIAVEIPDLKIILAHIGVRGFTSEQAIMVAEKNSNVFVETSWASTDLVKEAITKLGPEKVIFGSDFPSRNPITELEKIKELVTNNFISESDYRKITGYNISHLIRKGST
jgi:predicted TIM-barrel fold metal-dependent hydrolase